MLEVLEFEFQNLKENILSHKNEHLKKDLLYAFFDKIIETKQFENIQFVDSTLSTFSASDQKEIVTTLYKKSCKVVKTLELKYINKLHEIKVDNFLEYYLQLLDYYEDDYKEQINFLNLLVDEVKEDFKLVGQALIFKLKLKNNHECTKEILEFEKKLLSTDLPVFNEYLKMNIDELLLKFKNSNYTEFKKYSFDEPLSNTDFELVLKITDDLFSILNTDNEFRVNLRNCLIQLQETFSFKNCYVVFDDLNFHFKNKLLYSKKIVNQVLLYDDFVFIDDDNYEISNPFNDNKLPNNTLIIRKEKLILIFEKDNIDNPSFEYNILKKLVLLLYQKFEFEKLNNQTKLENQFNKSLSETMLYGEVSSDVIKLNPNLQKLLNVEAIKLNLIVDDPFSIDFVINKEFKFANYTFEINSLAVNEKKLFVFTNASRFNLIIEEAYNKIYKSNIKSIYNYRYLEDHFDSEINQRGLMCKLVFLDLSIINHYIIDFDVSVYLNQLIDKFNYINFYFDGGNEFLFFIKTQSNFQSKKTLDLIKNHITNYFFDISKNLKIQYYINTFELKKTQKYTFKEIQTYLAFNSDSYIDNIAFFDKRKYEKSLHNNKITNYILHLIDNDKLNVVYDYAFKKDFNIAYAIPKFDLSTLMISSFDIENFLVETNLKDVVNKNLILKVLRSLNEEEMNKKIFFELNLALINDLKFIKEFLNITKKLKLTSSNIIVLLSNITSYNTNIKLLEDAGFLLATNEFNLVQFHKVSYFVLKPLKINNDLVISNIENIKQLLIKLEVTTIVKDITNIEEFKYFNDLATIFSGSYFSFKKVIK